MWASNRDFFILFFSFFLLCVALLTLHSFDIDLSFPSGQVYVRLVVFHFEVLLPIFIYPVESYLLLGLSNLNNNFAWEFLFIYLLLYLAWELLIDLFSKYSYHLLFIYLFLEPKIEFYFSLKIIRYNINKKSIPNF